MPHVGAPGHAAGGVQRREGRAERADLIGAGLLHLAEHRDLVDSHPRDRDVEVSRGAGAAREFRVHAPEPCIQHVAQLAEGEVRDEHLSHLRDQDEPFTGDRERIGALDVAREDEDELVARAERVVRRNGAGERRQELSGGATEHVHAKHVVSGGQRFGAHRVGAGADESGVDAQRRGGQPGAEAERLDRGEGLRGRHRRAEPPRRCAEVGIEQVGGIAVGGELGAHLLSREAGLLEPLAQQRCEVGVLLEHLQRLLWGRAGRTGNLGQTVLGQRGESRGRTRCCQKALHASEFQGLEKDQRTKLLPK